MVLCFQSAGWNLLVDLGNSCGSTDVRSTCRLFRTGTHEQLLAVVARRIPGMYLEPGIIL